MKNRMFLFAVGVYLVVVALSLYGYVNPSGLNWGFHFLGLLPPAYVLWYCIISLLIIAYAVRGNPEKLLSMYSQKIFKKPVVSIVFVSILFLVLAYVFRQRLPLLGDGFVLLNNYGSTFKGEHPLIIYREPISIYYFYYAANVLGTYAYPEIMDSFLAGEFILGVGFIVALGVTVKYFFNDPKARVLAFIVLAAGAYMQLFFGYAEIYSVVLFFIALYIMLIGLWYKQKMPFAVITVTYLFMVLSHYLTVILFLSLLLVAYFEYKSRGMKQIIIGAVVPLVILLLILFGLNFDITRFIPPLTHAPYLSVTPSTDGYQAYTLFSLFHGIDLVNLVMLLAVSPVLLLFLSYYKRQQDNGKSFHHKFLLACVVPITLFIVVAKLDLGMATDWDAIAPYFFFIALFSLVSFLETERTDKIKIMFLAVAFTVLHSCVWVFTNANEQATLARTRLLEDERIIAQRGYYQNVFHLTGYYYSRRDVHSMIVLWEQYLRRFPDDERGYKRISELVMEHEGEADANIIQLFERWHAMNPANDESRKALISIRVSLGNKMLAGNRNAEAKQEFMNVLLLDSLNVQTLNNLGIMYGKENNLDSAITYFRKAMTIDSSYVVSFENMGKAFLKTGNVQSAKEMFMTVIRKNPNYPNGYENLAKVYFQQNDFNNGIGNLQRAARLGSVTSQKLLSQQNITW